MIHVKQVKWFDRQSSRFLLLAGACWKKNATSYNWDRLNFVPPEFVGRWRPPVQRNLFIVDSNINGSSKVPPSEGSSPFFEMARSLVWRSQPRPLKGARRRIPDWGTAACSQSLYAGKRKPEPMTAQYPDGAENTQGPICGFKSNGWCDEVNSHYK
ncbi:hypothetical protein HPP92_002631 [Vanilla planifolia]|uniref:Uncharacterized protein n=1 Tax=Vanilla planifolia TaxID=51239 RepID=A0A835S6Q3_VANPL|nr:hypothetical protein HPP92_002631 [Vanilla planifolia]